MKLKDYYQTLNVSNKASDEEIKKAFRRLAMQHHPDHNPDNTREAEIKFREINEAYEVLGDGMRRYQYDKIITLSETIAAEDDVYQNISPESLQDILQKFTGTGFMVRGMGWRKPWGCGRQGGQCRRQQRSE